MGAFRLSSASPEQIAAILAAQRHAPLSYEPVGAASTPEGWFDNRGGTWLGTGPATFEKARRSLQAWIHFDLGWVTAVPEPGATIAPGAVVAVLTRTFGLASVNIAKVIAVTDEPRRYAFSYGTTAHHVESGEETFAITWHPDDRVTYDVWSYSRPAHPLVKLFAPIARSLQRRFIVDSCERLRVECAR